MINQPKQEHVFHTWVHAMEVIRSINTADRNYEFNAYRKGVCIMYYVLCGLGNRLADYACLQAKKWYPFDTMQHLYLMLIFLFHKSQFFTGRPFAVRGSGPAGAAEAPAYVVWGHVHASRARPCEDCRCNRWTYNVSEVCTMCERVAFVRRKSYLLSVVFKKKKSVWSSHKKKARCLHVINFSILQKTKTKLTTVQSGIEAKSTSQEGEECIPRLYCSILLFFFPGEPGCVHKGGQTLVCTQTTPFCPLFVDYFCFMFFCIAIFCIASICSFSCPFFFTLDSRPILCSFVVLCLLSALRRGSTFR